MRLRSLTGWIGRVVWRWRGAAGVVLFGAMVARGHFEEAGAARVAAVAALAALLGERGWARLRLRGLDLRAELETALLLVVAAYAAIGFADGVRGPLHPIVYACAGFVAASERRGVAAVALALALAFEGLAARDLAPWHAGLLLAFAAGGALLFRAELWRQRRDHHRRIDDTLRALREEARDFRLIGPALAAGSRARTRAQEEEMLAQGSVEAIHRGLFHLLELLKRSLELRTCVLLWLDEEGSGSRLKIKEVISDSDALASAPFPARAGAPGAIVRSRLAVNLRAPGDVGLPYYEGAETVGAFLGVPVLEDGHVRGVLCADRRDARPFGDVDEQLLRKSAEQAVLIVRTERVLGAVERSKYETERFLEASKQLASALTLEQVYDQAIEAARTITAFDFAALVLADAGGRVRHRVCRVHCGPDGPAEDARAIEELEFGDNAGLVAMAVKNKHALEGDGEGRMLFTPRARLRGMAAALVVPLVVKDEAVGALALAARRAGHFSKQTADRLGVIANQVAVSIENAKMFRRMEEMATTDGLTGLVNHRTMQERLDAMLERSARFRAPLALLLCDIDHFKSINDTYGHPIGDRVLQRVGRLLADSVRKIDLCARYGGEEFALALEQTELGEARQLAERVRAELARVPFTSERGTFHVTLSVGLAMHPHDAERKEALVSRADQALYKAKQSGRNRVVAWGDAVRAAS